MIFFLLHRPTDRLAFVIGDVSGKVLPAAFHGSQPYVAEKPIANAGREPGEKPSGGLTRC